MTRSLSGRYTKAAQEAEYAGENEVDEVVCKVIKRRKFYNIAFLIGVVISHYYIK